MIISQRSPRGVASALLAFSTVIATVEPTDWLSAAELGHRYHPTSGVLLETTVTVFRGGDAEGAWWAWPGVSPGWSF